MTLLRISDVCSPLSTDGNGYDGSLINNIGSCSFQLTLQHAKFVVTQDRYAMPEMSVAAMNLAVSNHAFTEAEADE